MKIRNWFATGLIMLVVAQPGVSQTAGPAPNQQLTDEVAAADQALFSAFFDRCDLPALAKMVTDDLEMFHDKNGFMTKSGKEFLDGIAGTCARRSKLPSSPRESLRARLSNCCAGARRPPSCSSGTSPT